MSKKHKFKFTHHVRERYCERFLNIKRDKIEDHLKYKTYLVDKELKEKIDQASEEKSYLNNGKFMIKGSQNIVVTCYSSKESVVGHITNRPNYGKIKKRREKESED